MSTYRTAQRLGRILSMLPWVIANPGTPVEEVCERFSYQRRELLEDLNLVLVCGLPGYGPADLMWASVDDETIVVETAEYFSRPLRLTSAEALALLAAGMALMGTGQAPPALASAVEKLAKTAIPEDALAVELAAEPGLVGMLRQAAREGRVVDLTYTSLGRGQTTRRDVEPWSVFSALGNWYLSAYCRSARGERVFRVDRIREARAKEDRFDPPESSPPPVVRYTPGEDDVRCVIRLRPQARWVVEYYPIEVLEESSDGTLVRFSAPDPGVTARLLLRLGPNAELVEGPEVGEALSRLRERILARYGLLPTSPSE